MKKIILFALITILAQHSIAQLSSVSRNVLLEVVSSANEGWSSDLNWRYPILKQNHPNLIIACYHPLMGASFGDSLGIVETTTYVNEFFPGYPYGSIDRSDFSGTIDRNRGQWDTDLPIRSNMPSPVSVQIYGRLDRKDHELLLDVFSTILDPNLNQKLGLSIYIIEDSIVKSGPGFDQLNNYNSNTTHANYQAGNPIVNYPQRRVVREVIPNNDAWGDTAVFPINYTSHVAYQKNLILPLNPDWNIDQLSIVAFVSEYGPSKFDKEIFNAAEVKLNNIISNTENKRDQLVEAELYPNPANQEANLRIDLLQSSNANLSLRDLSGKLISFDSFNNLSQGQQNFSVNTAGLANGIYFLNLELEGQSIQKKISVIH